MNKISMLGGSLVKHGFQLIILVYLLLWLIMRPLGVFFLAILTVWIFITQCNLRILPPPELAIKLENLKVCIQNIRQTRPKRFYLYSTSSLCLLAVLGHYLSDMTVIVVGTLVSSLLMVKYRFTIIKTEPRVFTLPEKSSFNETDIDDEFLPEVNESNLCVLERASDFSTLSSAPEDADELEEDKSDEIPSDLLIPDTIPEIDENYSDDDDDDVEDLVPILNKNISTEATAANYQLALATAPGTASTDILSNANEAAYQMEFKKRHFKRDSSLSTTSSSSDDESLSKGLQFPDHTAVDGGGLHRQLMPPAPSNANATDLVALAMKSQSQALLGSSNKLIPSLLSGLGLVMAGGAVGGGGVEGSSGSGIISSLLGDKRVVTALDSSDESDFEILESDDFQ